MKVIWKYGPIHFGLQQISIPKTAEILSAQMQGEQVVIWALVDNNNTELRECFILLVGTGHEFDICGFKFLNTVQNHEFVWHIFYEKIN